MASPFVRRALEGPWVNWTAEFRIISGNQPSVVRLVEPRGIEPLTFAMPFWKRVCYVVSLWK
jgi:hypothetical protein